MQCQLSVKVICYHICYPFSEKNWDNLQTDLSKLDILLLEAGVLLLCVYKCQIVAQMSHPWYIGCKG